MQILTGLGNPLSGILTVFRPCEPPVIATTSMPFHNTSMSRETKKANGQSFLERRLSKPTKSFIVIGASFVAWASLYIYRSSVVGIDGRRYFSLMDDAMISMRYAWNLSHGSGLVWNPGEYVEGYTNLLMTLLMSLPTLAFDKVAAVLAVQIFGIVFMLVNAYLVMSIAEHLASGQERYYRLFLVLAFLGTLSYYPLVHWSLLGMETGLLAVLLSLSVLSTLRYAKDQRPAQGMLLSVSLGLAFLTRPDALIFAIPIFVYLFYAVRKSERRPKNLGFLLVIVTLYVLFIVGQELFRWAYYGEWLPNTYIIKVGGIPLLTRIENGIAFTAPFLNEVFVLLIVVGAGIVLAFQRNKLFLVSFLLVAGCYQVWVGGDTFTHWRFLAPVLPIMLMLGVYEILMTLQYLSDREVLRRHLLRNPILRQYVPGFLACLLTLGVLWSLNWPYWTDIVMITPRADRGYNQWVEQHVNHALVVDRFTTPEATVGVAGAGIVPYYSGRTGIDFLGKMDPRIARLPPQLYGAGPSWPKGMIYWPGHNKFDLEYSLKQLRPTYAEEFKRGKDYTEWAQSEYVTVAYKGVGVNFLKDSKDVLWGDIEAAVEAGEATLETPQT